jgi:DNA-binding MarR family transcriptional regulator
MNPETSAGAQHPRYRLSETLHQPVRFSIVAALAATESMDFGTLRDRIQVSDSVLSKQVTILEQAEIVQVKKGFVGKRPRTWLTLTKGGRQAWADHLATLREIAGGP